MIPSLASIVQMRILVAALLKVVAVFLCFSAFGPLTYWLFEGISNANLFDGLYRSMIVSFITAIVPGIALFVFASPLSRAFVPMRYLSMCPRCRYPLVDAQEHRCSECGLPFPKEFVDQLPMLDDESRFAGSIPGQRAKLLFGIGIACGVASSLLILIGLASVIVTPSGAGNTQGDGFLAVFIGVIGLLFSSLPASLSIKMKQRASESASKSGEAGA